MKYAIGIVTYQPDIVRLRENLAAVLSNQHAGRVIIVDNHSTEIATLRQVAATSDKIHLIENDDNTGIAHALNQIFLHARQEGCEWVLTLDQDSVLQPNILVEYECYTSQADIGIVCPRIEDRNMGRQYARSDHGTEYIEQCITAGNLVRIEAWDKVGGFCEELFIDGVDFDFCLRIRQGGYRILRTNNVFLTQEVGHGRAIALPFHHQISILNHSPLRLYYMVRNYLYIGRKYHQLWFWSVDLSKLFLIVILFEHNRRQKLRYMLLGVRHFMTHTMGKLEKEPS